MFDSIRKSAWFFFAIIILLAMFVFIKIFWLREPSVVELSPSSHVSKKVVEKKSKLKVPAVTGKKNKIVETEEPSLAGEDIEPVMVGDGDDDSADAPQYILCEHVVVREAQYEFSGEIRLINRGVEPIDGWSVHWEYEDGSTIVESANVALGGGNPYTGEHLDWNSEIAPGATVTFSFTGIKGGSSGPKGVKVEGDFCM